MSNHQNKMQVNFKDLSVDGISNNAKDAYLPINLADDYDEVRGFGRPITPRLAKQMAQNYYDDYKSVQQLFTDLAKGKITTIKQLIDDKRYITLIDMLSPDKHIISGVFGKEIIFQLLAQKDCEGIRYIIGKTCPEKKSGTNDCKPSKTTVLLIGVKEAEGHYKDVDGNMIRKSSPVKGKQSQFNMLAINQETESNVNDPLTPEVHAGGKTVADIHRIMRVSDKFTDDNLTSQQVSEKLFGEY